MIQEIVTVSTIRPVVGGIIQLDGAKDGKGLGITEDKVQVLGANLGKCTPLGFAIKTFANIDYISQADLTENAAVPADSLIKDDQEFLFSLGEEFIERSIGIMITAR
jgi:hypothetical protein